MAWSEDWKIAKELYEKAQIVECKGGYTLSTILEFLSENDYYQYPLVLEKREDWETLLKQMKDRGPLINY
jgi:hypothetical protein